MKHILATPTFWLYKCYILVSLFTLSLSLTQSDSLTGFHTCKSFKTALWDAHLPTHTAPLIKTSAFLIAARAFDLCIFWSNSCKQPSSQIKSNFVFLNPFALPLSLSCVSFSFISLFLAYLPGGFSKGQPNTTGLWGEIRDSESAFLLFICIIIWFILIVWFREVWMENKVSDCGICTQHIFSPFHCSCLASGLDWSV